MGAVLMIVIPFRRQAPAEFAQLYPTPWLLQDREVVDCHGDQVQGFDPDEALFWAGVVAAVNRSNAHSPDAEKLPVPRGWVIAAQVLLFWAVAVLAGLGLVVVTHALMQLLGWLP